MGTGLVSVAYVVASVLFILSLGGLSHQESARRGNLYGVAGIVIAVVATLASAPMPATRPDQARRLTRSLSFMFRSCNHIRPVAPSPPVPCSPPQIISTTNRLAASTSSSPWGSRPKIHPVSICSIAP